MKSSFCIDLQRFMLIPTKFPLTLEKYWFHKILWIKNKQKKDFTEVKPLLMDLFDCMFCDPHGARTHDPNIKSVVLYQLS